MAWPEWIRVSVSAVAMARRLRRSGRQDLIDAVERGEMSLDAALKQIDGKAPPSGPGGKDAGKDGRLAALAARLRALTAENDPSAVRAGLGEIADALDRLRQEG